MEDEVDALFKLPLGEFTPARNALAARLRKGGHQNLADAAKALPKPSVAAWVVNQLYWQYREPFDRLIKAGDRFRQVQSAPQTRNSGGVRQHLEARREAQAALVRIAADVLREGGYSGTRDMLRRVTSTLEALSTYGSLPDAPRAGRLTAELEPPGFDMVAVLLPLSAETRREAVETHPRPRGPPGPSTRRNVPAARARSTPGRTAARKNAGAWRPRRKLPYARRNARCAPPASRPIAPRRLATLLRHTRRRVSAGASRSRSSLPRSSRKRPRRASGCARRKLTPSGRRTRRKAPSGRSSWRVAGWSSSLPSCPWQRRS